MIRFSNQVPSVYPSASRDFQYLCWLIDIVLNAVKHNVDDIYALPDNRADDKLTELLATTLGFKVKRNYDQAQLRALVVVLPRIIKYKGTKVAVDLAGNALLAASGADGSYMSEVEGSELHVVFPETLVDISLFNDLLEYILPAGMTCHLERTNTVKAGLETKFAYKESIKAKWIPDVSWDDENQSSYGLANMYDVPAENGTFANYTDDLSPVDIIHDPALNSGLLDNSVIPALYNTKFSLEAPTPEVPEEPAYVEVANDFGTTVVLNKYNVVEDEDNRTVFIGED